MQFPQLIMFFRAMSATLAVPLSSKAIGNQSQHHSSHLHFSHSFTFCLSLKSVTDSMCHLSRNLHVCMHGKMGAGLTHLQGEEYGILIDTLALMLAI